MPSICGFAKQRTIDQSPFPPYQGGVEFGFPQNSDVHCVVASEVYSSVARECSIEPWGSGKSAIGTTDIIASGFNPGLTAILFLISAQGDLRTIELDAEVRSGVKPV
jgi:hypothetical protein